MSAPAERLIDATQRLQRWAHERPVIVDIAVAVLATVVGLSELAGDDLTDGRDPDLLAVILILGSGTTLLWRRVAPLSVLATVTLLAVPVYLRDYGTFLSGLGLTAIYSAAAHGRNRRQTWLAVGAAVIVLFAAASVTLMDNGDGYSYANALNMTMFCASAAAVGAIVRNRHEIFVSAQTRAEHAEATRLAEADRAVARERLRIARDMHDVVAHSMSVMAVQAAAAQEITRTQPDRAIAAMQNVERTGRQALDEMRRMLGVLRGDDADTTLAPQPTLANIADTVAQSVDAGLATTLEVSGERRDLPPGIEVAAFRIVQEALTNVRRHAGATALATVRLKYGPSSLGIEIVDDGAGAAVSSLSRTGSGNGLLGMRERVEIYNGEFEAAPRAGGGFAVRVMLLANGEDEIPPSAAHAEATRKDAPQ